MRTPTTIRSNPFKFLAASALLLLGACAQTPTQHHYSDTQIQQSQASLQAVRDSYNNGNYGDVITRVARDASLSETSNDIRIEALKLQAFSLCMSDYTTMCRDRFQTILALQPDFDLNDSERGHPQWGPVFEQAKQAQK